MGALELAIAEAVRGVVAEAVEPLRLEVARLRGELAAAPRLVTTEEAVATLGVSRSTVQRMVKTGLIPSSRVNGARRLDISGHLPRTG
jgi:excisionase family DNA binding protein